MPSVPSDMPAAGGILKGPGRRFRRDERGAVAIEFAVIAPIFFILIFLIAETALVFIAEQVMGNAVSAAARMVRTGQVQGSAMGESGFRAEVCGRVSFLLSCDPERLYLDVRSYGSFADLDLEAPLNADETFKEPGPFEFGTGSEIVVLRAYYQWPTAPIFGELSLNNLHNGRRLIGTFSAFRNEPFA